MSMCMFHASSISHNTVDFPIKHVKISISPVHLRRPAHEAKADFWYRHGYPRRCRCRVVSESLVLRSPPQDNLRIFAIRELRIHPRHRNRRRTPESCTPCTTAPSPATKTCLAGLMRGAQNPTVTSGFIFYKHTAKKTT